MFVFMYRQHCENFAFLNPKNCNVICPKFVNFLKSTLIFSLFYCF